MAEGLTGAEAALCALSFFRHRHDHQPLYKRAKRRHHQRQTRALFSDYVQLSRQYIKQARAAGFRASFMQAAEELRARKGEQRR
jgi:hypothetical protein